MTRSVLRENSTLLDAVMRAFDPLLVVATGVVAYRLYLGGWVVPSRYAVAVAMAALLAFAALPAMGLYRSQRGASFVDEVAGLFFTWMLIAVTGGAYFFLTKSGASFSRGWALVWVAGGFALHLATRAALRLGLRWLRRRGRNLRHVVIVGARAHGRSVAARLRAAAWSGLAIVAFYDDDPALVGTVQDGIPVRGPLARLPDDMVANPPDQVWIALPLSDEARIRTCLEGLRQTSVIVRFVPNFQSFHLLNHSIGEIAGMPVVNLTDTPLGGVRATWKAIEDYAIAALLVLLLSPLLALIAIAVKASSGREPVLYRQQRVTWNGRQFTMYKFRSMSAGAEALSGPVWSTRGEPRATPVGAFLRRFSLDELPQLVNVLRGEMSLVGPRPERPEFVAQFRDTVPGYMQKHLVKAGITGWAQVNDLRGDSDLSLRIQYDLYYVEHWSPWFDLRILALTLWHILTTRNAH
ncbi:MAG TPA: undecaprenyl-phosphate glucose phosphotransferase [Casimicrobiaceae bacterium]|nr:undecaprenyl-phosphate glucose phosphotransferase [Casimicrobiaceae bacterium]